MNHIIRNVPPVHKQSMIIKELTYGSMNFVIPTRLSAEVRRSREVGVNPHAFVLQGTLVVVGPMDLRGQKGRTYIMIRMVHICFTYLSG